MVQICEGTKTKHDMLAQSIEQYKDMFIRARGEFNKVVAVSLELGDVLDLESLKWIFFL
jgi:DNA topoisomerase-3